MEGYRPTECYFLTYPLLLLLLQPKMATATQRGSENASQEEILLSAETFQWIQCRGLNIPPLTKSEVSSQIAAIYEIFVMNPLDVSELLKVLWNLSFIFMLEDGCL